MTPPKTDSIRVHRRQTRLMIYLPFAGGVLLLLLLVVFAQSHGSARVGALADIMLTVFMLCPLVLCTFPVYLLVFILVAGMNRAHDKTAKLLTRAEDLTVQVRDRTYSLTDRAARASINLNSRFAFLDRLSRFGSSSRKGTHEQSST